MNYDSLLHIVTQPAEPTKVEIFYTVNAKLSIITDFAVRSSQDRLRYFQKIYSIKVK